MTREQIKEKLRTELNYVYCYNCAKYGHEEMCGEWCHRKSIGWKPSNQLLEWIMDVCGVQRSSEQKNPCDDCQEFDCYGCEYSEREEE